MSTAVLLLNADYTPIKVIAWEKAVYLLLDKKAATVVEYAGRVIHSANFEMAWPAVVALTRFMPTRAKVRFNRANLLARDSYTCQYCGIRPTTRSGTPFLDDLTIDHVVPRAQSKGGEVTLPWSGRKVSVTCWENVVTACFPCNSKKADRTPGQAGLVLAALPGKPNAWDTVRMALVKVRVPPEWRDFIPEGSGWRDYWDNELDSE